MDIWWNTLLFASKWIFVILIYVILFVVLHKVREEIGSHLPADSGPGIAPGRIRYEQTGNDRHIRLGDIVSLSKNQIAIGRHNSNDLILTDDSVSRQHAKLSWNGRFWEIEDLESSSGSWLNGQKLPSRRKFEVEFNSEINIGNIKFRLIR